VLRACQLDKVSVIELFLVVLGRESLIDDPFSPINYPKDFMT